MDASSLGSETGRYGFEDCEVKKRHWVKEGKGKKKKRCESHVLCPPAQWEVRFEICCWEFLARMGVGVGVGVGGMRLEIG